MSLNQLRYNNPEPFEVSDLTLTAGQASNLTSNSATITNLTATKAVITGPITFPNVLPGNYTIESGYNGLLAGPINVTGSITINGVLVVV